MNTKKMLLMILDGWGEGDHSKSDAIWNANIPFIKSLYNNPEWAYSRLNPAGEAVGLPEGQMGNSEVGHLNIGGGRVVYQDLVRINIAVRDGSIEKNTSIIDAYNYARQNNKAVHLIGLIGDGGVHSMSSHLLKLCDIAQKENLERVFIHAITDGRDTDPHSGYEFVKTVKEHIKESVSEIATICGRYYTMDRDKRWERVKLGYDLMVHGKGKQSSCVLEAIKESYDEGITDEFIKPVVITDKNNKPVGLINKGDVVICFNFRTDRLREITTVLSQKDMPEYGMSAMELYYLTMTRYDDSFKNVHIIYDKEDLNDTLGEVISKKGKKQIRIAETEKYPHVTFFFSGGREETFEGEKRILIPSPKVATYDLQPEMSAYLVKDAIIPEIEKGDTDFICLNFANADMVGHTGFWNSIVKALETVDLCVKQIAETAIQSGYSVIITADHGNADFAVNDDGSPNTAHSTNLVPFFLYDNVFKKLKDGKLADIAPTILKIMDIPVPELMTGQILVEDFIV